MAAGSSAAAGGDGIHDDGETEETEEGVGMLDWTDGDDDDDVEAGRGAADVVPSPAAVDTVEMSSEDVVVVVPDCTPAPTHASPRKER